MTDAPPHDLEAEEALLGAVMISRAALAAATDIGLLAADFYRPAHAAIWTAACAIAAGGALPDTITLAGQLNGELGPEPHAVLSRIQLQSTYTGNAGAYAQRVRDCARRRALMALAADLTNAAITGDDTASLLEQARAIAHNDLSVSSRLIAGGSFVLDAPDRPTAIWGTDARILWAAGESLYIVGPAGVGKTTLVIQLVAGRLGVIELLLDLPVAAGGRGLYLAADRPSQIARAFGRLCDETHRQLLDERLTVWKGPPPQDFGRNPTALLSLCRLAGADFVIIDSLKDVALGLSDDDVAAGLNSAIQLALAEGIDVVALHHQRKGQAGAKPRTLEDVYGNTWVTAGAGSVVLLWGDPGDPLIELRHLKQPAAEVGPFEIEHDQHAGRMRVSGGIVDPLIALRHARDGLTATELAVRMYRTDKPARKELHKARRHLERLADAGLAIRREFEGSRRNEPSIRYYAPVDEPTLDLTLIPDEQRDLDEELLQ